jgi:DHA2 family multidrug resistance protein-like MFS transporter
MLIAARALLGIAGAALSPSTLSLIRSMFHDPQERTRAISIWSASFAAGSACGPLVGGFLLEHFPWGAVFLVPLPVMGVLLLVGPRLLPEFRDPTAKNVHVISIGLSLAAILTTVYGLKAIVQEGVGGIPLCAIALGGVLGVLFIRHQQRLDNPLIDIELFRSPQFSATLFVFMLNAFVMFASSYVTAQYLQLIIGLSPLQAGLWSLPSAVSVIAGSMLSPVLLRWLSRSAVLIIGLLICACGFGVLTGVEAGGLLILVGGSIVAGVGAGAVSTLVPDMIVGAVSLERAGSAASLSSTSAELGGVLGLAILGSIGLGIYRLGMTGTVPQGVSSENALLAEKTLGGAVEVANHLPPEIKTQLLDAAHRAFTQTFVINAVICGTLMLLAVVIMTLTAMMTHSKQK